jgi:transposase
VPPFPVHQQKPEATASAAPGFEELAAEVERLRGELARKQAEVEALRARVGELERLVEELARAAKRQSAPFAKGAPKATPKPPGRKPGNDYGTHAARAIPERVDATVDAPLPDRCPDCGAGITLERVADQYLEDLTVVTTVTRVRVQVGRCGGCGRRVQGRHPAQVSDALGAAGSQVGPRAQALAAELNKTMGLSLGKTARVLGRLGLAITPGGVAQVLARVGERATPSYDALTAELQASPMVAPDETGWRIGGRKAWLWGFATPALTVYHVACGRGFDDASTVLPPDFAGVLCRDGWAPYRRYQAATHQSCLGHLLRRTGELLRHGRPGARAIPAQAKGILTDALAVRDRRDAGELAGAALQAEITGLQARLDALLARRARTPANRRLLKHLRSERDALLTFLRHPGVDATNWRAEQAMRPAVVNRKVWGGNRTDTGARTQEVLTSVLRTATQQGLDAIAMLEDLLRSRTPTVMPFRLPLTRPG